MKIRILRRPVPGVGKPGSIVDIAPGPGRLLIKVGLAAEVAAKAEKNPPKKIEKPARRGYRRRDLVAETPVERPTFEEVRRPLDVPPTTFSDADETPDSDAP